MILKVNITINYKSNSVPQSRTEQRSSKQRQRIFLYTTRLYKMESPFVTCTLFQFHVNLCLLLVLTLCSSKNIRAVDATKCCQPLKKYTGYEMRLHFVKSDYK